MGILNASMLLGIPTLKTSKRSVNWTEAMMQLHMPLGNSMGREWIEDRPIAEARNLICSKALEIGCKYVMMLGDDVLAPPEAIMTFLNKIGRKFEVKDGVFQEAKLITGIYWTKEQPPEPYIYNGLAKGSYKDWIAGEFFPIDLAGCDCLFIDTDVLRNVPYPWFKTDWVWEPGQFKASDMTTEDFYFYSKCKKYGYQLFADTSIQCLHEDRATGAYYYLTEGMVQLGHTPEVSDFPKEKGKKQKIKNIADIGAGLWAPPIGKNCKFTRFDIRSDSKPDVRCDILNIPETYDHTFDVVFASHVLEHCPREETVQTLTKWAKLLKVGGELIIRVPNLESAFRAIIKAIDDPGKGHSNHYHFDQIYGGLGQGYENSTHLTGFVKPTLLKALTMVPGLVDCKVEYAEEGQNLRGTAKLEKIILPENILEWLQPELLTKVETITNEVM